MKKIIFVFLGMLATISIFSLIPSFASDFFNQTITENVIDPPGLRINMFDYWTVGEQMDKDNNVDVCGGMHTIVNSGINQGHLLLFGNGSGAYSGIDNSDWSENTVGEWNCYTGDVPQNVVYIDGPGHPYRGIVSEELGDDGYPELSLNEGHIIGTHNMEISNPYFEEATVAKTNESLAYLFSPNKTNTQGKAVYENVTGLFRKDDNEYYYFNSDNDNNDNNCFAELNIDNGENKFVLYKPPWLYNDKPQFFPFSKWTDLFSGQENDINEKDCDITDDKVKHYFGMTMEYEFTQPKDGVVKSKNSEDEDMTLEISGNDDIWLFIDNKLVVDMGGIHQYCKAEINFKTGVIKYYNNNGFTFREVYLSYAMGERASNLNSEKWKELKSIIYNGNNLSIGTFADNTKHTIKLFYLERGNDSSDFGIRFNLENVDIPPVTTEEPTMLTVDSSVEPNGIVFNTITDAVAAAKAINPTSEDERVVINVNPGNYEEQVEISGMSYVTIQQTPGTTGKVDLNWYYCTGYAAANCDLESKYNPNVDWYNNPPKDSAGHTYKMGELIKGGTQLTYTTVDGNEQTVTTKSDMYLGNSGALGRMAALLIQKDASNIIIKDIHVINSVPVMVTQGQKDAHLTPTAEFPNLPARDTAALTVSENGEDTPEKVPAAFSGKQVSKDDFDAEVKKGTVFDSGESTWLARSGAFNERGHAVACYGDKITFDNIYLRGGQDSLYIADRRVYFKNSTIIGGTDYIYGSAAAVFDSCKLGLEGFSDRKYGSPIAVPATPKDTPYGYLFYKCILYNVRDNNNANNFGGSWGSDGQETYYKCVLDDANKYGKSAFALMDIGWDRFGSKDGMQRLYEYGTTNSSGKAVDFSKRVKNKSVAEGGFGMGTVIDEWQVLEFNPRNYFSKNNGTTRWSDDWDPMNYGEKLSGVDDVLASANIDTSDGTKNEIDLPTAPQGYEFKWESDSEFAVVSGNKLSLIRPANGEQPIDATVILYARTSADTSIGDKKSIPFKIQPTSDTENVFTLSGNVTLNPASDAAQTVTIRVKKNNAVIKTVNVNVPANQTTVSYTAENIPVGTYTVTASISDTAYNIDTAEAEITGVKGGTQTFDVSAKKMKTITKTSADFAGMTPTIISATGFSASVYTATGSESANLGEAGNVVYKLTKDANAKVANNVGVNFDLKELLAGGTLNNTKTIKFNYDFLMETTDYYPSDQSYFDLATSTANAGKDAADQTRFVRWAVMKGWGQINLFGANNTRINGDNTQFDKNSTMKNRWYRIEALIDLENKSITSTLYDRDKNMEILNKKPFTIVAAGVADYPTDVDLGNLYFNIYMDRTGNTTNKMEYYIDNISIEYQDFE